MRLLKRKFFSYVLILGLLFSLTTNGYAAQSKINSTSSVTLAFQTNLFGYNYYDTTNTAIGYCNKEITLNTVFYKRTLTKQRDGSYKPVDTKIENKTYMDALKRAINEWNLYIANFNKSKYSEFKIHTLYEKTFSTKLPCYNEDISLTIPNHFSLDSASVNKVILINSDDFKKINGGSDAGGAQCKQITGNSNDQWHKTDLFELRLCPDILGVKAKKESNAIFSIIMHELGHSLGLLDFDYNQFPKYPVLNDSLMCRDHKDSRYWPSLMDLVQISRGWTYLK